MLIRKQNNYSEEEILDSLLEKAFCEGYSYAQKEFNSKEAKRINNKLAIKAVDPEFAPMEYIVDDMIEKLSFNKNMKDLTSEEVSEAIKKREGRKWRRVRSKENPFEMEIGYEPNQTVDDRIEALHNAEDKASAIHKVIGGNNYYGPAMSNVGSLSYAYHREVPCGYDNAGHVRQKIDQKRLRNKVLRKFGKE